VQTVHPRGLVDQRALSRFLVLVANEADDSPVVFAQPTDDSDFRRHATCEILIPSIEVRKEFVAIDRVRFVCKLESRHPSTLSHVRGRFRSSFQSELPFWTPGSCSVYTQPPSLDSASCIFPSGSHLRLHQVPLSPSREDIETLKLSSTIASHSTLSGPHCPVSVMSDYR